MKEYMKPVLFTSDELAEGVYLASGDGSGCYTTTAYIHQTPPLQAPNWGGWYKVSPAPGKRASNRPQNAL